MTRRTTRAMKARVAVASVAAALLATTLGAASASADTGSANAAKIAKHTTAQQNRSFAAASADAAAPLPGLYGIDKNDWLYHYTPNGSGGLQAREPLGDYTGVIAAADADNDGDGYSDDAWIWTKNGDVYNTDSKKVGYGWTIYSKVLSPGNIAGAQGADVLARDKSGVLYAYLGYGDGTLTKRIKIGSGWNQYNQITGRGDLTGDGKADIVARDSAGVLWLYKGTGNVNSLFSAKVKIGAGWNQFNTLVGSGDIDLDGKADLLARTSTGDLYLYKGTGSASPVFAAKKKIGYGFSTYRLLYS
ncbi:VCBS repeat-containing protein [Streptomyces sp. NPDC050095]|uniref:FG-GAP repeat domain-containing protein n=1 Tax=unclassified Streptomyces TaxID=2593676 RepID=UPI00341424A3